MACEIKNFMGSITCDRNNAVLMDDEGNGFYTPIAALECLYIQSLFPPKEEELAGYENDLEDISEDDEEEDDGADQSQAEAA